MSGRREWISIVKRIVLATLMTLVVCVFAISGCGNKGKESEPNTPSAVENQAEQDEDVQAEQDEEAVGATETESFDDGLNKLEAIGDVDVDKGLFNVTLTIPKDFIGDITQEELDESVKERGYKSATLNSDGSVTYVMTKAQHEEMLAGIRENIDNSLAEMVGSSNYPNITDVKANDNYTSFTITTENAEPDLSESFAVMGMYMYGGMYGIFSGEEVDNIHVDYVNADSGEIISSADSKDMAADSDSE